MCIVRRAESVDQILVPILHFQRFKSLDIELDVPDVVDENERELLGTKQEGSRSCWREKCFIIGHLIVIVIDEALSIIEDHSSTIRGCLLTE